MNYKNHKLTFERVSDFDGITDSTIDGSHKIESGICERYYRSGYHKSWYLRMPDGSEKHFNTTFDELKAIDDKPLK